MRTSQVSRVVGCCFALSLGMSSVWAADEIFADRFEGNPEGPHTQAEAARFLTQASFGPTLTEIDRLLQLGYNAWLTEQLARPASLQLPFLDGLLAQTPNEVGQDKRVDIWFQNVIWGNDQLRQRVAFALSEILVISDQNGALEGNPNTIAHYFDGLATGAFGNYRDLLENVTLHPAMGHYLSMFRNRKPDESLNIRPDENYAREIMQLFSVGLIRLNTDGTPLDGDPGTPGVQTVPTYTQDTIRGFAHVFTGWNYSTCTPPSAPEGDNLNWWDWEYCPPSTIPNQDWRAAAGYRTPLKPWGEGTAFGDIYHATTASKQLLNYPGVALSGGVLPAGGSARADMEAALDNVFNHPNVGPFVGRLLIQRLTTSNPSPDYIERVATVFNNNGQGVRGDLGAVVRAILMDPEARSPAQAPAHFGKLREPLLRVTQLWRAMQATSIDGRVREWTNWYAAQGIQSSPTVFNFFLPNYQLPGEIATSGLYSPEFQITTDTFLTRLSNEIAGKIYYAYVGNPWLGEWQPVLIRLERDMGIAHDAAALIDRFNLLFMAGQMSSGMRTILIDHVNGIDFNQWTAEEDTRRQRVQDALWLILTSPEYVVEK
ncbi:MAG: DUF1800 domain-containing protein [Xanthomonadales bacterium]|nr:DUF1800 domain-containing protein [Xanthomonadales bacterium]HRD72320.1 DUF1800 family protein [Aquimonas sp.]